MKIQRCDVRVADPIYQAQWPDKINDINGPDTKFQTTLQFQGTSPVLIASVESMNELLKRLKLEYSKQEFDKNNFQDITFARMRPNIVIQSINSQLSSHFEDEIKTFCLNNINYYWAQYCDRCPIPQIDTTNAKRCKEPKSILMQYRSGKILEKKCSFYKSQSWFKDKVFWGTLFATRESGIASVGDVIHVNQMH